MKSKILLAVFMGLVALAIVSSCNKDESKINKVSYRTFNFYKFNEIPDKPISENIQPITVAIIVKEGIPILKSEEIVAESFTDIDGKQKTIYTYKHVRQTNNRIPVKTGWVFQGDCFYWCKYLEAETGEKIPLECCDNSNCIGFDPQCGGWT